MSGAALEGAVDPSRATLRVSGPDAEGFLQGLLTNDVSEAGSSRAVYAALLTPQGKFLFDAFLLRPDPKQFLLEVAASELDLLQKRLTMYKLRAHVEIARATLYKALLIWPTGDEADAADAVDAALKPARALGLAYRDPRHAALGVRILVESGAAATSESLAKIGAAPGHMDAYHARRVRLGVPISGDDIVREETFPLEVGFDQIGGVDFRKGCYVGQEVSARMKHKGVLKKALFIVDLAAAPDASPGDALTFGDRPAGVLGSVEGGSGLALLRVDRAEGSLGVESGGEAVVERRVFGDVGS